MLHCGARMRVYESADACEKSGVSLAVTASAGDDGPAGQGGGMGLGVIGATGWLGTALGTRLLRDGWAPGDIVLLNRSAPRAAYDAWPGLRWMPDAAALCREAGAVVLSVRPGDFPMPGYDGTGKLVLSFMAGWSLDRLQALHPGGRVVRAMPNAAASAGQSFTPWVAGPGLTGTEAALIRRLLRVLGGEAQVADEAALDYLSALSGSGAAYPALMAQAMLAHARGQGLPEDVAQAAVASVLASGAGLTGQVGTLNAVLDAYRGYRGITAAGLDAAEAAGFAQALGRALDAATAKARAMTRDGAG